MTFDRTLGQAESRGDFDLSPAGGSPGQHFPLTVRERSNFITGRGFQKPARSEKRRLRDQPQGQPGLRRCIDPLPPRLIAPSRPSGPNTGT